MRLAIEAWRPDVRNTRQGYCDIRFIDLGLVVRDFVVHHHAGSGRWWLAPYAREYAGQDGQRKFWPLVLLDPDANKAFQAAAVAALAAFVDTGTQEEEMSHGRHTPAL